MGCETKRKGEVGEAAVLARLVKLGFAVLQPFGDNQPYDLVIEKDGEFFRLQCKSGKLKNGVISFKTVSTLPRLNGTYDYKSYDGKIDFFAVYCPDNEEIYLVPVDDVGKVVSYLRVEKTKNSQTKGVRLAEKYILNEQSFDMGPSSNG